MGLERESASCPLELYPIQTFLDGALKRSSCSLDVSLGDNTLGYAPFILLFSSTPMHKQNATLIAAGPYVMLNVTQSSHLHILGLKNASAPRPS